MKKLTLALFISGFALSAQASEYPAECKELIDLTFEAAELQPEIKAQLGMTKEDMLKVSEDAWKTMSDADKQSALAGCKAAAGQQKQVIEALKAQKK
ncbi:MULTISPECIES: hypothetical protein [Mannheimia]|uniref:Acid stress chaperone HdeA n=1 Tax=Mannheimia pernigra TaxID=111844 RepID=A0A7H8URZ6_9PAST|nr:MULTISPECIES: hypothetical protein [Mannheimia]QHB17313.1 hypothetical protein GM695_04350 [Mannheimia pernigra]QLB40172.1 hypothetical protein HV559_04460 [Mannheimia pernigra]QLB42161.1 hypothetical protein HV560_04730 [Mannheimia pernigra]QLB44053.1 hypothetical protein HV561_04475 [Mannheimia pernigra]QTM00602.1 hypothetical protein GM698_02670 [Mannheimia sp. ZY171111]